MAETIESYLVSLGFKYSEADHAKMKKGMEVISSVASNLEKSLLAVSATVVATTTAMARAMDTVYYASQRTNTSVSQLKSMAYAVSQLGGSYAGATQSLENFAQKMRSNPAGMEGLLRSLGVRTRQDGALRSSADLLKDTFKRLAKMRQDLALQYLPELGVDEQTYRAAIDPRSAAMERDYERKVKALGADLEKAAAIGRDFQQAMGGLGATLELLGVKLEEAFGESMAEMLRDLDKFIIEHANEIVAFFNDLKAAAVYLATTTKELWTWIKPLVEQLAEWGKAADELAKRLTGQNGLTVALETLIGIKVAMWLAGIASNIYAVGAAVTAVTSGGALGKFFGILTRFAGPAALAYGLLNPTEANGGEDQEIARRRAAGTWGPASADELAAGVKPQGADNSLWGRFKRYMGWGGSSGGAAGPVSKDMGERGRRLMDRLVNVHGWTPTAAAIAAGNAEQESGIRSDGKSGDGGTSHGMFQWRLDRFEALQRFAAARGKDWRDFDTQVDFFNEERKGRSGLEKRWHGMNDFSEAGAVGKIYERYSDGSTGTRVSNAQRWLNRWNASPVPAPSTAPASPVPAPDKTSGSFSDLSATLAKAAENAGKLAASTGTAAASALTPGQQFAGGTSTTIAPQQTTTINVTGPDAQTIADSVIGQQDSVNARMIRNMKPLVR